MAHWKNASQTNDEISRLKRDAIIREAARIFSRDGFHNASLDDVARVLDVSKGTLYNYVRDKQEILFELVALEKDLLLVPHVVVKGALRNIEDTCYLVEGGVVESVPAEDPGRFADDRVAFQARNFVVCLRSVLPVGHALAVRSEIALQQYQYFGALPDSTLPRWTKKGERSLRPFNGQLNSVLSPITLEVRRTQD